MSESERLSIGELAKRTGVSTDTLRHYERVGAIPLPDRLDNGYRAYSGETVAEVELLQRAMAVGFTLDEIARMRKARASGNPPCRQVFRLASEKLTAVEQRIADLQSLRDSLRETLAEWSNRLTETPDGEPAHLLERLSGSRSRVATWRNFQDGEKEKK